NGHTYNHAAHNSNISGVYTLDISLNLNDFNPKYPKNPKTLGERIRKTRMDRGMKIKELAEIIGVTPDSIINWEIRGVKPRGRKLEKVKTFLEHSTLEIV
ncbi:MAG: hypothetical protein CO035_01520, partial [Candidatus Omnitrophica bacterium CG_4_9_14_0_2_um_filter_42_8]